MEVFVSTILPMLLYIAGIVALIILIILGIKLIGILNKADRVLDNVEEKVNSLNNAFEIIDRTTEGIVGIGNTVVGAVNTVISRVLNKKEKYEVEEDFEDE